MLKGSLGLAALATVLLSGVAMAQEKIKIGVTATLEGTYTVLGEDGMRRFQTAINKLGTKIGDKQLEFVVASTDATHGERGFAPDYVDDRPVDCVRRFDAAGVRRRLLSGVCAGLVARARAIAFSNGGQIVWRGRLSLLCES